MFGLAVLLAANAGFSQQGQNVITTVAGTDWLFPGDGKPALNAPLGGTLGLGLAVDAQGSYYIADPDNLMVMKVTPDGVLHVIAGNGLLGFSGDGGLATDASIGPPLAVVVDTQGNVYFADLTNRIRKIDRSGIISTVAGTGDQGFRDGPAAQAMFNYIFALALDSAGNLYAAEQNNHRIRRITPGGTVDTIAGNGSVGYSGDGGPALSAALNSPYGVAVDRSGTLYFTDQTPVNPQLGYGLAIVRKISGGTISTVEGPDSALLVGIAVDHNGTVYVGDALRASVFQLGQPGATLVAGQGQSGVSGYSGDGGPPTKARLRLFVGGLAFDANNNLYIADDGNSRIRKISGGNINTIAGNGAFRYSGEKVAATSATLYFPTSVAVDNSGSIYIAEPQRNRIRRIGPAGIISTFAGTGEANFTFDDGPANQATLNSPYSVAPDTLGNVYIADSLNSRVRKVGPEGHISTVAGTGAFDYAGDGKPAKAAVLNNPQGVAVDAAGNVYISDTGNNVIRRIDATSGLISTVAGNHQQGSTDGPAASASFNAPLGLAVDSLGAVYVADSGNNRVRKISNGTVTTVAGTGRKGYTGDGSQAVNASLNNPYGVVLDTAGNLYIADYGNYVVRKVTQGVITTIAGNGVPVYAGDGGPALQASIAGPTDVALDSAGDLLIADWENHRIRAVLAVPPTLHAAPQSLTFQVTPGGPLTDPKNLYVSGSIPGIPFSISADHSWLHTTPSSGVMPATVQAAVDQATYGADTAGSLTVTSSIAGTGSQKIAVALTPGVSSGPGGLNIDSAPVSFALFTGASASTQYVAVSNSASEAVDFTAAAANQAPWLQVLPASGKVPAGGRIPLAVIVNPSNLKVGTHTGHLVVTDLRNADTDTLKVTVTVTAAPQSIFLTEAGLTFTAVAQGGVTPPQNVGVLNLGLGTLNWTTRTAPFTEGPHKILHARSPGRSSSLPWVTLSPGTGSSGAARTNISSFTVSVNPAGLSPGNYYGQVEVDAPGADNSPQSVLVVLTVLPAGATPTPIPQPAALVFNATAGGVSPGSQVITVTNLTGQAYSFTTGRVAQSGQSWFKHLPAVGAIAPGESTKIVIQPLVGGLAPGVYRNALTLLFNDGSAKTVSLVFIVAAPPGTSKAGARDASANCAPTTLVPVFTSLGTETQVPAGWPQQMVVRVLDDCGGPMVAGNVVARFSQAIPPLALTSLADGNWSGTFQSRNLNASSIDVTVQAQIPQLQLQGTAQITSSLNSIGDPPQLNADAVVSAASLVPQLPVAPGTLITMTGTGLASASSSVPALPLPNELAGTQVALGGTVIPLVEVANDHVTALVPYDVPQNTRLQLIVVRGDNVAVPESVTIAPAEPAVFSQNNQGTGQGLVYKLNADNTLTLAQPGTPARAGDVVVLLSTGLGAVNPPVQAGAKVPTSPAPQVVTPLSVSIGGADARIVQAILANSGPGLYLVAVVVPAAAPAGSAVPVVVTAGTESSPPVTLAIQ